MKPRKVQYEGRLEGIDTQSWAWVSIDDQCAEPVAVGDYERRIMLGPLMGKRVRITIEEVES